MISQYFMRAFETHAISRLVALALVAASLGLFRGERRLGDCAKKVNGLSPDLGNYNIWVFRKLSLTVGANSPVGFLFFQFGATSRPLPVEALRIDLSTLGRFAAVCWLRLLRLFVRPPVDCFLPSLPPFVAVLPLAVFGTALARNFAPRSMRLPSQHRN
jgi:hypothetical protein